MYNDNGKQEIGFPDKACLDEQAKTVDSTNHDEKESNEENTDESIIDERENEKESRKVCQLPL